MNGIDSDDDVGEEAPAAAAELASDDADDDAVAAVERMGKQSMMTSSLHVHPLGHS
jgi:hypothetical protein